MNWGDELCGVKVTPESWAGGITSVQGEWLVPEWVGEPDCCSHPGCGNAAMPCDPIFPPRGWAGKSDAELLRELGESRNISPYMKTGDDVWVEANGTISACCSVYGWYRVADPAALILALQNAQVLARRLQHSTGGE